MPQGSLQRKLIDGSAKAGYVLTKKDFDAAVELRPKTP
jgi:hypothetical protein